MTLIQKTAERKSEIFIEKRGTGTIETSGARMAVRSVGEVVLALMDPRSALVDPSVDENLVVVRRWLSYWSRAEEDEARRAWNSLDTRTRNILMTASILDKADDIAENALGDGGVSRIFGLRTKAADFKNAGLTMNDAKSRIGSGVPPF